MTVGVVVGVTLTDEVIVGVAVLEDVTLLVGVGEGNSTFSHSSKFSQLIKLL